MKHFINDIEISPRNRTEIGIKSLFTGNPNELELTTDSIILPREAKDLILNHIQNIGIFEGIPYRIQMNSGTELNYYIDLTESLIIKNNEVEVSVKKRKGFDNFKDRAQGTTFELMAKNGVQFNTIKIPYFIIQDDQLTKSITLGISIYILSKEAIEAGKAVFETAKALIKAVTPVGLPIPGPDWGAIIILALELIFKIAYFALILIALIKLAAQLFTLIFPPKRNLLGCKIKELCLKGCQHLGFNFQSTILDNESGLTLLPVPLVRNRKSWFDILPEEFFNPFNKGYPSSSDTTPTLWSLLETLESMFNAKVRVYDGIVYLERRDYWVNNISAQIIPALNIQGDRDEEFSYNSEEIWKRYYIHYANDFTDSHCIDGETFDYNLVEYSTEPLNIVNQDLVSIKGLNEVSIPFALGSRKDKLNWVELIGKGLFLAIDAVTGIFGGGTNYGNTIGERKDCLKISAPYFSTTKLLWTINGKQPSDYLQIIGANALWQKYHSINQIQLNGWILKENARIKLTDSDFISLLGNNYANINGLDCEVLEIEYFDESKEANITYRIPNDYATGKVNTQRIV
jgi:hypothetical protein